MENSTSTQLLEKKIVEKYDARMSTANLLLHVFFQFFPPTLILISSPTLSLTFPFSRFLRRKKKYNMESNHFRTDKGSGVFRTSSQLKVKTWNIKRMIRKISYICKLAARLSKLKKYNVSITVSTFFQKRFKIINVFK